MQTKSSGTSTNTILVIILLIVTFPIWIGIAGGILGAVIGIFGAVIGAVFGIFGAMIGVIGRFIGWIFHWNFHTPFVFWNTGLLTIFAIALLLIMLAKSRR
jgi:hypothetical protein